MSNTNDKIELFKQYRNQVGHDITLFTTTARGNYPIKGMISITDYDSIEEWHTESNNLIEKLRDNGIPEQFPLPPEKEGYTWEPRGWGWDSKRNAIYAANSSCDKHGWKENESHTTPTDFFFYVEYIHIPKPVFVPDSEETLAKLPKKEGYKPVYRGKAWLNDGNEVTSYATTKQGDCEAINDDIRNWYPQGDKNLHYWEYVPIVTEMTMEQVCEALGKSIKIIK